MALDKQNKNTKWKDAADLEIKQIFDYQVFIDHGHHSKSSPPAGYKKIRVHLSLMSNTMVDTKEDWSQMDISRTFQSIRFTLALFLYVDFDWHCSLVNSMAYKFGQPTLGMRISKQ
jgi:hypothetical protein